MQNVWDVTETVTEERVVEEIPPNTQEQVPWHLSMERHGMTGELSKCTGEIRQQEAAEQPPLDHESDQGKPKYKEDLVETNQRADGLEFIREFQEMMDQAFEKLLSKPVRRHSCQKDKPELHMEQGKHKETIHREAERPPQTDVSRDSDDKWNSITSQEMMDKDQCIQ